MHPADQFEAFAKLNDEETAAATAPGRNRPAVPNLVTSKII
jgi:hypothetical protein